MKLKPIVPSKSHKPQTNGGLMILYIQTDVFWNITGTFYKFVTLRTQQIKKPNIQMLNSGRTWQVALPNYRTQILEILVNREFYTVNQKQSLLKSTRLIRFVSNISQKLTLWSRLSFIASLYCSFFSLISFQSICSKVLWQEVIIKTSQFMFSPRSPHLPDTELRWCDEALPVLSLSTWGAGFRGVSHWSLRSFQRKISNIPKLIPSSVSCICSPCRT